MATIIPEFLTDGWRIRWSAYMEFKKCLEKCLSDPSINIPGLVEERIWEGVKDLKKVQQKINDAKAKNSQAQINSDCVERWPQVGVRVNTRPTFSQRVMKIQSISNSNYNTSAWLHASPAHIHTRMDDTCFRMAMKQRLLIPVVNRNCYCECGQVLDPLATHTWICSKVGATFRNAAHPKLKDTVKDIAHDLLKQSEFKVERAEPTVERFFPRNVNEPHDEDQIERRADILIRHTNHDLTSILIDVTMVCPAAGIAEYKTPGDRATKREKDKYEEYRKHFNIEDTSKATIYFFGVETTGALGLEAMKFCKLMAEKSPGNFSETIKYIYQRIAVQIQGIRASQIMTTLRKYSSPRTRGFSTEDLL